MLFSCYPRSAPLRRRRPRSSFVNEFVLLAGLLLIDSPARAEADQGAPQIEVPRELSLTEAVRLTLSANPGLKALSFELSKAQGRSRQAHTRPNPELSLGVENAGGTLPGFSGAEATLSVGQILELAGRRSKRAGVARAEEAVVSAEVAAGRIALVAEVGNRFLEAIVAERAAALADEEVRAAEEASATTSQRVRAGAAHPVEARRADVELANGRLERATAHAEASLARSRLSLLWGDPTPRFERLLGDFDDLPDPPSLDSLARRAEGSPMLARWTAEAEARRRQLALERARRTPDVLVQAGVRSLSGSDDRTFVGGVSLPLPLFDRNRGAIDEASAALDQISSQKSQVRLEVRRALGEALVGLELAHGKLGSLRRDVLPEAARAFEEMRIGFERGRFTYLDLLEARRTWIRARREVLQTLLSGHLGVVELERLIGGSLTDSNINGELER